jgi:lysylphosphatidylglycerol synthetase-like protein (DUF2156 family)
MDPINAAPSKVKISRQSSAYIAATLGAYTIAALIAYSWTSMLDNWFKVYYPDEKSRLKPRFITAIIVTVIALVAFKMILQVKKL